MKMEIYLRKIKIRKGQYRVEFNCDYCNCLTTERESHYKKKKRHFCSAQCYSKFRKEYLPKEEHNRYGTGYSLEERQKRVKARSTLNHYLRDKKINRPNCMFCKEKAEAHHDNYDRSLDVKWLCFKHNRKLHENPELLDCTKN